MNMHFIIHHPERGIVKFQSERYNVTYEESTGIFTGIPVSEVESIKPYPMTTKTLNVDVYNYHMNSHIQQEIEHYSYMIHKLAIKKRKDRNTPEEDICNLLGYSAAYIMRVSPTTITLVNPMYTDTTIMINEIIEHNPMLSKYIMDNGLDDFTTIELLNPEKYKLIYLY